MVKQRCCYCCWGGQRQALQVENREAWHIPAGEQGPRGHGAKGELDGLVGGCRLLLAVRMLVVLLVVGVLLLLVLLLLWHGPSGLCCQLVGAAHHVAKQLAVCGLVGGCAGTGLPATAAAPASAGGDAQRQRGPLQHHGPR